MTTPTPQIFHLKNDLYLITPKGADVKVISNTTHVVLFDGKAPSVVLNLSVPTGEKAVLA